MSHFSIEDILGPEPKASIFGRAVPARDLDLPEDDPDMMDQLGFGPEEQPW